MKRPPRWLAGIKRISGDFDVSVSAYPESIPTRRPSMPISIC